MYQAGHLIIRKCKPFSSSTIIFDAEAYTVLAALEEALLLYLARFASDIWVLLDN